MTLAVSLKTFTTLSAFHFLLVTCKSKIQIFAAMELKVYDSSDNALRGMTERLIRLIKQRKDPFHLALSGAGTAQRMYKLWVEEYQKKINWEQLRFYWVDERCVDPLHEESNFKHADELLFRPLNIPLLHIHRIHGERKAEIEAEYYSEMVKRELPEHSYLPRFNCVILGIGKDGHTASIFPQNQNLLTDKRCYVVSRHPQTEQERITMTGPLILNSKAILIPVIGQEKTNILREIVATTTQENDVLPAAYIVSHAPEAIIFTDSKISIG